MCTQCSLALGLARRKETYDDTFDDVLSLSSPLILEYKIFEPVADILHSNTSPTSFKYFNPPKQLPSTTMRFSAVFTTLAAVATLASAVPTARTDTKPIPAGDCTTGPIQCCKQTQEASGESASLLLGLLGVVLEDLSVLVGLDCSPVTVIGGVEQCTASPVCCENNSFGSLISIGCLPIDIL